MRLLYLFVVLLLIIGTPLPSKAAINIDITQGNVSPLPIALSGFVGVSRDEKKLGHDLLVIIAQNLHRSGLFRVIEQDAFIENITTSGALPHFASWRQINASGIVTGSVILEKDDTLKIDFRLWDAYSERQISGKSYTTKKANWRRVAHLISDKIYERLTGETGYFDTRIVYISEQGPPNKRIKRLAIMDQDGAKHTYLTDGKDLVLTPRFSPKAQKIIYMSYINNTPRVYVYDLDSGVQEVLGDFEGMSFAPRFSPKGNRAILSASLGGNSEIFVINLKSKKKKRLTYHSAIDTSPSFSPDEKHVVFNSDRGGSQQLYVMDSNGKNVKRISFGQGRYGTPVWSPRGDLIAFTKMYQGKFHIGVMRPDGSGERILTESYMDEGPTWSPNGRVIIYTRQFRGDKSPSYLYSIDLTGYNEIKIETPHLASDPAWSPLL